MTVKELMKKLIKMDPNATVRIEVKEENTVNFVKPYVAKDGRNVVYLADDTIALDLDSQRSGRTIGTFERASFLSMFIEEEIPFRLRDNFHLDPSCLPAGFVDIVSRWFVEHSDMLFDYDAIDDKITDFLDAFSIHYGDEDGDEQEQA